MANDDPTTILILSALKVVTIALGFVIVYKGWQAYKKTNRKPMLWLTIAIAILTISAISEGAAYQGLHWTLDQSHLFEGVVTLIGFIVLVYSLYV